MLSPEELLRPRYKVTNTWPGMHAEPFGLGQIVTLEPHKEEDVEGFIHIPIKHIPRSFMWQSFFDLYPHLFEPLPWWKDRRVEEMPEYVKAGIEVYKIVKWIASNGAALVVDEINGGVRNAMFMMNATLPATEADYNAYLQTTNQLNNERKNI